METPLLIVGADKSKRWHFLAVFTAMAMPIMAVLGADTEPPDEARCGLGEQGGEVSVGCGDLLGQHLTATRAANLVLHILVPSTVILGV